MRRFSASLAVVLTACSSEATLNLKDPASVARAFSSAYNSRDLARILPLVEENNRELVGRALADGQASEAYARVFQSQMADFFARDGGRVEGPRFDHASAVFKVGGTLNGDVYTIELSQHDTGEWLVEAFRLVPEQEFLGLPLRPATE